MPKPSVLIVGAGALGLTTGYHLALAGADITFLVRPGRVPDLQAPTTLYCYDDGQLKTFADYRTVDTVAAATDRPHDFVLITPDGATCRGAEMTTLLTTLGDAIRPTDAVAMVCGIGVHDHILQTMKLPASRLLQGTMSLLSYQTDRVTLPVHPPVDPAQVAQAAIAYRHMGRKSGFMVADEPEGPARAFAALYDRNGVSTCKVMNATTYTMFTAAIFPVYAVFDLAGWPDAETLAQDRELMALGARAMAETLRLPRHGWRGKLASLLINRFTLARMNLGMEQSARPADFSAFNRFHHGGKVRAQDIDVMRQSAASGGEQGMAMPALNALIKRYEAHCGRGVGS